MLLSRTAYLARAIECDNLAVAALEPKLKSHHSIWAGYYRFMAEQVAKLEPCGQVICELEFQAKVPDSISPVRHATL
jgi:hypothetical protein